MGPTDIGAAAGAAFSDFILKPKCPWLPDLSLFLGEAASSLHGLLSWMGAPTWPFGGLYVWLFMRAQRVKWARLPLEERMQVMTLSAICSVGLVVAYSRGKLGELLKKAEGAAA